MVRSRRQFYGLEKRMAQSGGYDLNDPFIDDGNLINQPTCTTVRTLAAGD